VAIRATLPVYADQNFSFVLGADNNFWALPISARIHTQADRQLVGGIYRFAENSCSPITEEWITNRGQALAIL
jgi:hypothetical protein